MPISSLLSRLLLIVATAAVVAPAARAATLEGGRLTLFQGETKDPLQSNRFITVISRKNGSLQVFYRDPDDGHKLLQKEVATGCSIQLTYWDFHRSRFTQTLAAQGAEAHASAPKPLVRQSVHPSKAQPSVHESKAQPSVHESKAQLSAHEPTVNSSFNSSANKSSSDNYISTVNTSLGPCIWKHFPLKVFLQSAPVSYFGRMRTEVCEGLDAWSKVSQGKITFQFVDSPKDADIVMGWTASMRNMKNQNESGETNVDYATTGTERRTLKNPGDISHARITFCAVDKNRMAWRRGDFRPVAIHEIGHSLGLMGHSRSYRDIMYAMKNNVTKPSARDINTLNLLYGSVF